MQQTPGGIIHTYQKYDPVNVPSPRAEPPDLVSPIFDHLMAFGDLDELTPEQLANAIHIDPSQIKGLGPTLESLRARLLERKRKILETYETDQVQHEAAKSFLDQASKMDPPGKAAKRFQRAVREEQLHELEELYFAAGNEQHPFAKGLVQLLDKLGAKYQIDELASKYDFTGRQGMTVPEALEIKEELELIDKLLKQLEEAKKTAQIAIIDLEELQEYAEPGDIEQLRALQQQVEDYIQEMARQQGLEKGSKGYELTPKAYRIFQSRLLETIFSELQAARSGRHQGPIIGEGAIETTQTKPYEFGDSVTHMDIPATMINAMVRQATSPRASSPESQVLSAENDVNPTPHPGLKTQHSGLSTQHSGLTPSRIRIKPEDIVIQKTKNNPKCATAVLLDMSGSMRYGGLYINVKRMGLALEGLIRREFPGDFLQFIEMYSFAKLRHVSELVGLMPKPVTIYNSVVRLKADLSNPKISEWDIPHHFTNIQHALQLARQTLTVQDTPNRQVILITDGLPTAHFDGKELFLLYPPDPRTEEATLREAKLCARAGITINIFLLSSWNQSEEDVHFAYRLAESTQGRVFFVAGKELDRFVLWDYLKRRRQIIA